MRIAITTLALLAACSSNAQAACKYDLYIYQPAAGASIYALTGDGGSSAIEVRGCGDVNLLPDAQAIVQGLEARRAAGDIGVVTVDGPGSRVLLGACAAHDEGGQPDDDDDSLVIVEDATAAQMRRTIASLDAAPREVREQLIGAAGLRTCSVRS